jgi:hypothetical protein
VGAADFLTEVRLDPGPPWLAMGTRPYDDADWLVVDERLREELRLKEHLLAERPADVFLALPAAMDAAAETLGLVTDWLVRHRPDLAVGPEVDPGLHPLDRAGRLVQEDLCLMLPGPDDTSILGAGSVCFPSHWRLADKLGLAAAAIHAPVPHYDDELRDRVDRFLARLRPGRGVQRRNLSVHDHDTLFAPEPHESPASFTDDPADVWLRSERQTLRRLPRSGAVLFTIKTQQCRVVDAADEHPELSTPLAARFTAIAGDADAHGAAPPFPRWLPGWLSAR